MLVIYAAAHKMQTGKTLIRLLLQKQSDMGLHCLSTPFYRQLVFGILEHLPQIWIANALTSRRKRIP